MKIEKHILENALTAEKSFTRLLEIMDLLRANCPWDKSQTFESLRYLSIEEVYELSDAIMENEPDEIKKELGDLLLHIVFYAKIGQEKKQFDITAVCNGICEKLIRRHPHVFAAVEVNGEEDVKNNWEKIKLGEKQNQSELKSVLGGVPKTLPAMVKAFRMQEKARGVGFDWENTTQVWDKVLEENAELHAELEAPSPDAKRIEAEFGDLLFSLINYARFIGVNPEDALERTNKKFISRFKSMEEQAHQQGLSLPDLNLAQMELLWENAKKNE